MKKVLPAILGLGILLILSLSFVLAEGNCTETDDGQDFEEKGTRTINCTEGADCGDKTDYCKDNNTLIEYYCESDNSGGADKEKCRYGCEDGVCLTGSCSSDNFHLCWDKNPCKDAGGFWYNYNCNEEPQEDEDNKTEDNENNNSNSKGLGQTIRRRVKAGTYTSSTGEQIRVSVMARNRTRLHVGDSEVETELEVEEETEGNRTKLKIKLSNSRKVELKIMPSVASATALARLRLKNCNAENNCTIELKEVGKGNQSRIAYEIQRERHFRLYGLFKKKAQVKAQIDAETGEIISIKKPWWAFLASEPEEETEE